MIRINGPCKIRKMDVTQLPELFCRCTHHEPMLQCNTAGINQTLLQNLYICRIQPVIKDYLIISRALVREKAKVFGSRAKLQTL